MGSEEIFFKTLLDKLLSSAKFVSSTISEFIGKEHLCSEDIHYYYFQFLEKVGEDVKLVALSENTELALDERLKSELLEFLEKYFSEFIFNSGKKQIKIQYFDFGRRFDPLDLENFMNRILLSASIFGTDKIVTDLSNWRARCEFHYTYRLFINDVEGTNIPGNSEISIRKLENSQQLPDLFLCIPALYDMFVFHVKAFKVPEKDVYLMNGAILEFTCKDIPILIRTDSKKREESFPQFKYKDAWYEFDTRTFTDSMVIASGRYVNTVFGSKTIDSLTQFSYESTQIIERPFKSDLEQKKKLVIDEKFLNLVFGIYLVLIKLQDNRMKEGINYLINSIRPNFDHFQVKNKLNELQRLVDLRSAIEAIFLKKYEGGVKGRLKRENRFNPKIEKEEKDLLVKFYEGASAATHVNQENLPLVEKSLDLLKCTQNLCFKYVREYFTEPNL